MYIECESCWLINHGYEDPYHINRVAKCAVYELGGKRVTKCPCFQCLTKTLCRVHCKERLIFWETVNGGVPETRYRDRGSNLGIE